MPRIVDWEEFTELPVGTVYWEYDPVIFINPGVVHKWIDHGEGIVDFSFYSLRPWVAMPEEEVVVCEAISRWGVYDYDQLFCVLDDGDISSMISILRGAGG